VNRDALFSRFVGGLFLIMVCYGVCMSGVLIFGSEAIATRMLATFSAMFAGVLGLGSGYLLGARTNGNGNHCEEKR
jgi:hypothetical protein